MKIAFDQQIFLQQQYGGISRYICNLARYLDELPGTEARIFAPLHRNANLAEIDGVPTAGLASLNMPSKLLRAASYLSKGMARFSINRFAPDIVHETYFTTDDYRPPNAARIVTVHDMIHERFAGNFTNADVTTTAKKAAVERADHIICVSHNTQRDLIEIFDVPIEKTSVTALSADRIFTTDTHDAREAGRKRPYFLYVGGRGGYKNFLGLLEAFAKSTLLLKSHDIVCFGGGPFTKDELRQVAHLGFSEKQVVQVGGDDSTLVNLYQNAQALVYPSIYEGFGIPPLEAMACGCAVICSATSSVPEVVRNAGEYFDPKNGESIISALESVASSTTRREELITLGHLRRKDFSWEKCARETQEIYMTVCQKS